VGRNGLERFLYRLSVSPYRDSFVLNGALLLQLWTWECIVQPEISICLGEVCSQEVEDDGLTFLPDTIRVERIRDDEAYEAV
jgi:hypothetical protein